MNRSVNVILDDRSSFELDCASILRFGEGLEDEEIFDDLPEKVEV